MLTELNNFFLDESPDAFMGLSREGEVSFWSKGAQAIFGFTSDEAVGLRYHDLIVPTERLDEDCKAFQESIDTGFPYKSVRRRKDHSLLQVDVATRIISSNADSFILSRTREISHQHKAESEVHELDVRLEQRVLEGAAELQAARQELEAFAYSISHDLRAPLRHINGYVELLRLALESTLQDRPRHFLTEIAESAEKMNDLVESLLGFSRLGRVELRLERVDLNALVQAAIGYLGTETQERNIHWKVGPLPIVHADRAMLTEVLINLFSNAIKYTRSRNPAEIEIGTLSGIDQEMVVFVRDNGIGFDMEFARQLFGVFQRLHSNEDFEGLGIGLANVRRIITRHGGKTWAEGKPDEGATFYFSLSGATR